MQDKTIEYKVKIFISSQCGGKYTIVRKALKELLLETNMSIVYVFETADAGSQIVANSYLNRLDDSDLCIFLIDNSDGVTDAVLTEQKRARTLKKKSIYLFCDENEKESTQMQKEITNELLEKFFVVHEFSDFTSVAYHSAIQDIVDIYRLYCSGHLIDVQNINETEPKIQIIDTYILDKKLFKGFDLTSNELIKLASPFEKEIKETSQLDELCMNFISSIMGSKIIDINTLNTLRAEVISAHDACMTKFIEHRFNSIIAYYSNDLTICLEELDYAYTEANSNIKIPNWLSNDVSVDMRNIQNLIDQTKNLISLDSKGQQLLNENLESVYFPLLDRFENNLKEDLLKKHFAFNTDSPYTTNLGGLESFFKNIASSFHIAVM
jgi:hypothetical protein